MNAFLFGATGGQEHLPTPLIAVLTLHILITYKQGGSFSFYGTVIQLVSVLILGTEIRSARPLEAFSL